MLQCRVNTYLPTEEVELFFISLHGMNAQWVGDTTAARLKIPAECSESARMTVGS